MLANTNSGPLSLVALGTSKSFQAQTLRLFRVPHSVVLQKFHLGFAASPELGSGDGLSMSMLCCASVPQISAVRSQNHVQRALQYPNRVK